MEMSRPGEGDAKAETVRNCPDIVQFLLKNKFSSLSCGDKLYIKQLEVPRPNLNKCPLNGERSRKFANSWYNKCKWLTGSLTLKKLFCWPCVLFSLRSDAWSKTGYDDLKNLSRSIERHSKSQEHLSCTCKLHLLGKQNIETVLGSAHQIEINKFNDTVRKSREIFKRLIDICIFLCNQEFAFGIHNESSESLNRENFKELVSLMIKRDIFKEFFNSNLFFSEMSKTIQNELIDCISHIVLRNIDLEVDNANFFSWQIDETSDISCCSQLSVVLRYVRKGTVVERFMGFYDASSGRTADNLFKLLTDRFKKFDLENKLIGQTYDGAAVIADHLNALQMQIISKAPHALFTHCYAHCLNLVLSDSCSAIPQVRMFFAHLSGFSSYFSKATKRTNILDTVWPMTSPTRWNFKSRVVSTVHSNKSQLIDVFNYIINNPSKFDNLSIREASGLKNHLENSDFIFYLEIFNLIFQQTDVVFPTLQNKFTDIVYSRDHLQALLLKLRDFKNQDRYFDSIFAKVPLDQTGGKRRKSIVDARLRFRQIFNEILDTVVNQIEIRFMNITKLIFFDLLKTSDFVSYTSAFPQQLFNSLLEQYRLFDSVQLKNELCVLYNDNIFGNSNTPFEMLKFITNSGLHHCMPELYKLICLVVTIPVTSASVESSFSSLKRIKTYMRNTIEIGQDAQDRLSNISLISIEKDLVEELSQNEQFYDDIIDYFAETKNPRIPLVYKPC